MANPENMVKDARSNDGQMVEMLIEMGGDPAMRNGRGVTPLDVARDEGRVSNFPALYIAVLKLKQRLLH